MCEQLLMRGPTGGMTVPFVSDLPQELPTVICPSCSRNHGLPMRKMTNRLARNGSIRINCQGRTGNAERELACASATTGILFALLAFSSSAMAGEQPRFQLRWCMPGASQRDRRYTPAPPFFKRSICAISLRFFQRQWGNLEGRCVERAHAILSRGSDTGRSMGIVPGK